VLLLHGFVSSSRVPLHLQDVRKSAQRVHRTLDALARQPGFDFANLVGTRWAGSWRPAR
jgi:hypothetical protein